MIGSWLISCATAPTTPAGKPEELAKLGELALQRGDCRLAADSYAAAIKGSSPQVAQRATEVALGCDQLDTAFTAATRWQALAPDDDHAAALYTLTAVRLGRVADAHQSLSAVAARDKNPERLIGLLTVTQDAPIAQLAVNGVFSDPARSAALSTALGELALAATDFAKSEQQARAALARDSSYAPAQKLLARVLALQGKSNEALAVAQAAARDDENEFVPAETLMVLGRSEEARAELERLHTHGAPEAEVIRHLAMLSYEGGDWDEAQERFGELARQKGAAEIAVFYLSELAQRTGDPEAALAGYKHLTDTELGFEASKRAAKILEKKSDRPGAFALLDEYVSHHPERRFDALLAKVDLLSVGGDAKEALKMLDAAQAEYRHNAAMEYERAMVFERAGRVRDSVRSFEKLLALRPQDPAVKNALGYTLGDHSLDLPRAETLVRSALDTMPDSPAALDSLGWIRFRRGDAASATDLLARAYQLGKDGDIAAHWGEVLWATGHQDEARRIWITALARSPDSATLAAAIAQHQAGGPVEKPAQ